MKYRSLIISLIALLSALPTVAQVITRAQIQPYALRRDAQIEQHSEVDPPILFEPEAIESSFGVVTRRQRLSMPQAWLDNDVFLHVENPVSAYTIRINGLEAINCEDTLTPTDYNITPYLRVGDNTIIVISRPTTLAQLEEGVERPERYQFADSYIFTQSRLRIEDYKVTLVEHEDKKGGQLLLDLIVYNGFNYPETLEVAFDVYDFQGKLIDFSTKQIEIEAGVVDTVRFSPHLYGAAAYEWNPASSKGMQVVGRPTTRYNDQYLYSVMIFTKRNRVAGGYIPFKVGYALHDYSSLKLKGVSYNALGDTEQTERELREIKSQHYNTVLPDYPQPLWFYSLCDKIGLYVVDQAAINAPTAAGDKSVGGTPSNDPSLTAEYLERVQKMYYRTRNFSCVVAYSLGGDSGNGYNMYKAYQWLKEVEPSRPIIYAGAAGEWNSDTLIIE